MQLGPACSPVTCAGIPFGFPCDMRQLESKPHVRYVCSRSPATIPSRSMGYHFLLIFSTHLQILQPVECGARIWTKSHTFGCWRTPHILSRAGPCSRLVADPGHTRELVWRDSHNVRSRWHNAETVTWRQNWHLPGKPSRHEPAASAGCAERRHTAPSVKARFCWDVLLGETQSRRAQVRPPHVKRRRNGSFGR
jgi:hypothetical protein